MSGGQDQANVPRGGEFELSRFVTAQDPVIDRVLSELGRGRKESHWMWFIFPQIEGLGTSSMARRYAIGSLREAQAYLRHPVLGPRLVACTDLVNRHAGRSASEIFGWPDDMKFRSSMTLFTRASSDGDPYKAALDRFFAGAADAETMQRLR